MQQQASKRCDGLYTVLQVYCHTAFYIIQLYCTGGLISAHLHILYSLLSITANTKLQIVILQMYILSYFTAFYIQYCTGGFISALTYLSVINHSKDKNCMYKYMHGWDQMFECISGFFTYSSTYTGSVDTSWHSQCRLSGSVVGHSPHLPVM